MRITACQVDDTAQIIDLAQKKVPYAVSCIFSTGTAAASGAGTYPPTHTQPKSVHQNKKMKKNAIAVKVGYGQAERTDNDSGDIH